MNRPVTQFLACLGFVRLAGVLAGLHLSAANEAVDSTETRITAYSMLTHDGRRMVRTLKGRTPSMNSSRPDDKTWAVPWTAA